MEGAPFGVLPKPQTPDMPCERPAGLGLIKLDLPDKQECTPGPSSTLCDLVRAVAPEARNLASPLRPPSPDPRSRRAPRSVPRRRGGPTVGASPVAPARGRWAPAPPLPSSGPPRRDEGGREGRGRALPGTLLLRPRAPRPPRPGPHRRRRPSRRRVWRGAAAAVAGVRRRRRALATR